MKVWIQNKGSVNLTKNDFVGQGGEGSVYSKGDTAYKIYENPTKMIPLGKMQELSKIADPQVITPENMIKDKSGKLIGYTMRFIKNSWVLCQLFPRIFRERHHIDHKKIGHLVTELRQIVENVHKAQVLIVDLNEMNLLASSDFNSVYFIDADSFQTPKFPASALMPSIRDWKTPLGDFTEMSDWFSFGIISFQMFTGIHPFKGKHPKVIGLEDRMKAGISVFDKDVRVPKAAYPFDVIPGNWKDWYKAIFEKGERTAPPGSLQKVTVIIPVIQTISGDKLDIVELGKFDGMVTNIWTSESNLAVSTTNSIWLNGRRVGDQSARSVLFTSLTNKAVSYSKGRLVDLESKNEIQFLLTPQGVTDSDGRVHLKVRDKICELILTEVGEQIFASGKEIVSIHEKAARLYPGCCVQSLLGSTFVSVFSTAGVSFQLKMKELDRYKVVDARYGRNVLMVVGTCDGHYDRLVFRFDESFSKYDVRVVEKIHLTGLNFVVLDSGTCVCMDEQDRFELFHNKLNSKAIRYIEDPSIGGDMILARDGNRLLFGRGNKVCQVKLK